jgi:flagella basal body P-ring formation protein FlgA
MMWFIATTLPIALLLMPLAADAATAKVTLRAEVEVRPARAVTVGDIAAIDAPKELLRGIEEVTVATGPLPGERGTIDASYVRLRLKAANKKTEINVLGPEKVSIKGSCVRFTTDMITREITNLVTGLLPQDNRVYDVTVERPPRDIVAAAGDDVEIRPKLVGASLRPGINNVSVDVMVDGAKVASTSATVMVKSVAEVMVATDTVRQGEPITASNVTWERRYVTKSPDVIEMPADGGMGEWVARRMIRPGSVIRSTDVELPAAIKSGDSVSLIVKCGNVVLHTTAEAKQSGRAGDTIRVLAQASQGEVRAKVIEPGVVEIRR